MLKNKETEQSRELTELQQDLEHRMNIVDEVRVFFIFCFITILYNSTRVNQTYFTLTKWTNETFKLYIYALQ